MNENEVKYCSNCKREIPGGNFMMHIIHCQRKLALCQKCDEPVPHSEYAAHNANFHSIVECPDCGLQLEQRYLQEHKNSSCSRREICCSYCHIETKAADLAEHENYCGSRTEKCEDCGEYVMLKYQQLHRDTNHGFLKLEDEPGPAPSWLHSRSVPTSVLNDLGRQRKVSNASQDVVRPTAPSNRLSPSKRTNDMPQLNSSTALSAPKAVHKQSIQKGQEEVDIDRLLALRLSEQEQEMTSSLQRQHTPPYERDETELVALPCEFCHAMVPANQLVLHETGCEPQLTTYLSQATSVPKNRKMPEPQDDGLPCEFCGALFPPHALLQHQDICESSFLSGDTMFVNHLRPGTSSSNIGTKKFLNQSSEHRLFPPRRQTSPTSSGELDDRNPYLMEVRAALRRPMNNISSEPYSMASVSERSGNDLSSSLLNTRTNYTNGYTRRNGSTGAVPKQKVKSTKKYRAPLPPR
ncbi:TRAF-type zinc finger domain-containing protein 1-like isoform X1 [Schistocerca gregaria]|uniref:TRAF-type zinc finger domain-containing protein 1-like isoform X1 n=1 Tax=Schistocerca gregaria TaxID=7010 RepID=UPI00211EDE4E|nr:TRAF-type zinc finger domain-containing protein 1-like isoform X1 [Schistocerca gregaria]